MCVCPGMSYLIPTMSSKLGTSSTWLSKVSIYDVTSCQPHSSIPVLTNQKSPSSCPAFSAVIGRAGQLRDAAPENKVGQADRVSDLRICLGSDNSVERGMFGHLD